jgi:NAD(P)-dependent dehydrogenase (short-subunit alcohol dehydrogenase family)
MKLFIITGGSKGLGLALCEQFKAREYKIMEFSRSAPHEFSIPVDLADPDQSRRTVAGAIETIDPAAIQELIIVSNAGVLSPIGLASSKQHDEIVRNMNTNFVSAIAVLTELMAKFQSSPCRKMIVNISSGAAQKGLYGWSLYCAAKAGMENFIRTIAFEQQAQPRPFLPININPGVIDTEMQALIRATPRSEFHDVERFIQRKDQGLLVPPAKVAAAIVRIIELQSLSAGGRYETSEYGG